MSKKYNVYLKGGFSERKGIIHISDIIQTTSLNDRTRNMIYNCIENVFVSLRSSGSNMGIDYFCEYLFLEIFSLTKKHIPASRDVFNNYDYEEVANIIYEKVLNDDYNEVFDLIEGIIKTLKYVDKKDLYKIQDYENAFIISINHVFASENVNYKIISGIITDVINDEEIKSIDDTLNSPIKVVSRHYKKALDLLYNSDDYANSIKESISSVEAMCQIVSKKEKVTLKEALSKLKVKIHPALEVAFEKLYAYVNDSKGIRHANGIGEEPATFEEARFMLISCSAFVNYLNETVKKKQGSDNHDN